MLDNLNLIVSRFVTFMLDNTTIILGFYASFIKEHFFKPVIKVDSVTITVYILNTANEDVNYQLR